MTVPYWQQCLQSVRLKLTGSKYRWESYYNQADIKLKQIYCQFVNVDCYHPNGKARLWAEFSLGEREKIGRFFLWWRGHLTTKAPQGLSMADFHQITTQENKNE